jgi:ubiquinone/menaquinone biosynthesis C-methylase UbiE
MSSRNDDPVAIQRQYYTQTAADYDNMHAGEGDSDLSALKNVCALLEMVHARTLLDIGCGTGRGIQYLRERFPSLEAFGVEPVRALLDQAVEKAHIPAGIVLQGSGDALPFADESVDVVCSFSILHHVEKPNAVVREMLRVARKAVLIVDSNRFGQGRWPVRVFKLAAYKLGLWGLINYLKTGGKGYMITEGDGLAYSYSVYDSFDCLAENSVQLMMFSADEGKPRSWFHPLLTSSGVIAFAIKGVD